MKNAGVELSINTQIIDRRNFAWDLTIGGAHNKNKLVSLGKDDAGKDLPRIGTTHAPAALDIRSTRTWRFPTRWSDANGDGLIGSTKSSSATRTRRSWDRRSREIS